MQSRAKYSNRKRFTLTLSSLAAIYGAVLTYRLIGFQADAISDIVKFSCLIFFVTLIISCFWWTLIMRKFSGVIAGAVAAYLSVICIIPIPTLMGAFKANFAVDPDVILAVKLAAKYSLSTFSLAEFLAIPLSICVGIWAAK